MKKGVECELCGSEAKIHCESDGASLCWSCDHKVHGANFLVGKHIRTLLCHRCHSLSPWTSSGPVVPPCLSFCLSCLPLLSSSPLPQSHHHHHHHDQHPQQPHLHDHHDDDDEEEEEEEVEDDDYGTYSDDVDDGNDDDDEEDEDDDDDDENQVVPWTSSSSSSSPLSSAKAVTTSDDDDDDAHVEDDDGNDEDDDDDEEVNIGKSRLFSSSLLGLKRKRETAFLHRNTLPRL